MNSSDTKMKYSILHSVIVDACKIFTRRFTPGSRVTQQFTHSYGINYRVIPCQTIQ